MATATDDNAADEKSDKSIWQLLNIRCTRSCLKKVFCKICITIYNTQKALAFLIACINKKTTRI